MAFVVRAQSADSRPYGHTVTRFNWHAYWNSISEITDSNCSVWHNIARSSIPSQQASERQTRIKRASCIVAKARRVYYVPDYASTGH